MHMVRIRFVCLLKNVTGLANSGPRGRGPSGKYPRGKPCVLNRGSCLEQGRAEWKKGPNPDSPQCLVRAFTRTGPNPIRFYGKKLLWKKKQGPTRIRTGDDGFANRCLSQLGDRARKVSGTLVVSWRKENINNWWKLSGWRSRLKREWNYRHISYLAALAEKRCKRAPLHNNLPKSDEIVSSDKTTSFLHGWPCLTRATLFLFLASFTAALALFNHSLIV